MGSLSNVVGMIPGFNANMIGKDQEKDAKERVKRFLCLMDSMTNKELDGIDPIDQTRAKRICQGSGVRLQELIALLGEHKRFAKMIERMGKMTQGLDDPNMVSISDWLWLLTLWILPWYR